MGKPFRLTFEFTPKALGNRDRAREEQFTVTLRDISILRRLEAMESLAIEAPDVAEPPQDRKPTSEEFAAMIAGNKKQAEWKRDFAKKNIIKASNFSVIGPEGETVEVTTPGQLEAYCPDVLQEAADRLLFGAGEEELKNSLSPSSAASSATSEPESSTSTASATAK